jgi:hypothetical protein
MTIANQKISNGTVHKLPNDMKNVLLSNKVALKAWEDLTPLARNEWICWVTFVKKEQTRKEHLQRLVNDLKKGVRRPCCWIGCIHRTDKAISPSVQAVLKKKLGKC